MRGWLLLSAWLLTACDPAPAKSAASAPVRPPETRPDPATAPLEALLDETRLVQWKLPKRLREISGLALTADGRAFAIADERAEVIELDYRAGRAVKRFRVGDPVLAGDFEGLAAPGDALYAITSDGLLLRFPEGADRSHVPYERLDTGLGERCEIEGLASEHDRDGLLIACKRIHERAGRGELWFFRWNLVTRALDPEPVVHDAAALAGRIGEEEFSPSGLAFTPDGAYLLVVAARQRAMARFRRTAPGGLELDAVTSLPARDRHRQTEGLAVLPSGALMLADEGGKKRGRLGVYGQP